MFTTRILLDENEFSSMQVSYVISKDFFATLSTRCILIEIEANSRIDRRTYINPLTRHSRAIDVNYDVGNV